MIFRLLAALCSLILAVGCAGTIGDNSGSEPQSGEVSIAYLKSLCRGDRYRIANDYSVRGVVVATDWLGELNNSFVLMDSSGGLEVAIDCPNIANQLPIYSEITIFCQGLMLARIGGKIELGAAPTGDFPLDNIDNEMFNRYIRITGVCNNFEPKTKRFNEIGAEDIGSLIRFDNVRICDTEHGLSWCDVVNDEPVTTYRTIIDREGNRFAVRTLSTCTYALDMMPTNEISVIGVIDYSNNRYFLRIVNKYII